MSVIRVPPESFSMVTPVSSRREGQSLVEFAFVISPFLVLVFGIIEFAWALYGYNTTQHAAYEATRRAMVLGRPASNYQAPGNIRGSGLALTGCDSTILGTVNCQIGLLRPSSFSVDIVTPTVQSNCTGVTPPCFIPTQNVPPGITVSVTVRYTYQPLITYPFNFGSSYRMTGFATSQTQ